MKLVIWQNHWERFVRHVNTRAVLISIQGFQIPGVGALENEPEALVLLTVFTSPSVPTNGLEWLQHCIEQWNSDDVMQPEFLDNILFVGADDQSNVDLEEVSGYMRAHWGTKNIVTTSDTYNTDLPRQGPLVMWKGQLCAPYRLYDDPNLAFTVAVKPRQGGRFVLQAFHLHARRSPATDNMTGALIIYD